MSNYEIKMAIKSDLKKMAEEQRMLRNQRKTVRLSGERTMDPWKAAWAHKINRRTIFYTLLVYGQMRGKAFEQICPNYKGGPIIPSDLKPILDKYIPMEEEPRLSLIERATNFFKRAIA